MSIQVFLLFLLCLATLADDFTGRMQDRVAIERVYYNHRLGEKPPFEQVSPPMLIERLVREDLRKEAVLKKAYDMAVTPAMLAAEVQRINTTTRAPETLAEIKAALGHNEAKFTEAFAKPILVGRLLREKFENDDALHAATRHECERLRNALLAARTNGTSAGQLVAQVRNSHSNAMAESTWQLGTRPTETSAPTADEVEIKRRFGPNAQVLSSPHAQNRAQKSYFADLPSCLQNVLRAQLRQPGDVSAVIETPGNFLLYVANARTPETLTVATLSLPKRSYEQWLEEQTP